VVAAIAGQLKYGWTAAFVAAADIVKQSAWRSCRLIGRAYALWTGAAGEAGVARALQILSADVERTLSCWMCIIGTLIDPTLKSQLVEAFRVTNRG